MQAAGFDRASYGGFLANAGAARNSVAKTEALRVLRIISYLLRFRLRSNSITELDYECNLKMKIYDACESQAHRADRMEGCPIDALGSDAAGQGADVRHHFEAGIREYSGMLGSWVGEGRGKEPSCKAILSTMAGAVLLSRPSTTSGCRSGSRKRPSSAR
ncbi:hypothetical protein [Mesorhizobium muleiense]|uniref:Uncharacterized protein n=1 Tax=Mesorhizobium muleiense TaxID=1004279 RepID=A0A1G9B9L4_9HYPH|nr:hypothetical protein [Mesorhizobium muleiense]MCF6102853.1 hypothetical protein [Mesorhizobium muleiense]SDK35720.1 hypothetical protein SAMN05428953_114104 [Mesorhizobium muleiense]